MPTPACGRPSCAATCRTCGTAHTTRSCCRCAALYAGGQFQRRLRRCVRDAVLRHDDRRRLLPRHQRPRHAPHSIEALKTTGIRHLFAYSFMTFEPDNFPMAARYEDARRVHDKFHDPSGLTTIGFGTELIGGAASCRAARLLARAEGAELHPCQRDRHDRQAARGRPARADFLVIHGNLITNAELELMARARMPLCFTPTADTQGTPADVVRRATIAASTSYSAATFPARSRRTRWDSCA